MNQFLQAVFSNLVWTSLLAVSVALVARHLKRPALVHALWLLVLLKFVVPPLHQFALPKWATASPAGWFESRAASALESSLGDESVGAPEVVWFVADGDALNHTDDLTHRICIARSNDQVMGIRLQYPSDPVAPAPASTAVVQRLENLKRGLLGAWCLGSLLVLFLLVVRARRFHSLVKRTPLAEQVVRNAAAQIGANYGLTVLPTIRIAEGNFPPLLWCFGRRSSIVLPRALVERLTDTQMRHLLAHELAHFARGDQFVRILEACVCVFYWWCPVVWWVRRRLQIAEEQCCDAWVVWVSPRHATDYAKTLLATLEFLSGPRPLLPPLATGLGRINLVQRRFEMILHHRSPRRLSRMGCVALSLAALISLPWSTAVFAQPESDVVAESNEIGDLSERDGDLSTAASTAAKKKAQGKRKREEAALRRKANRETAKQHREAVAEIRERIHTAVQDAIGDLHGELDEAKQQLKIELAEHQDWATLGQRIAEAVQEQQFESRVREIVESVDWAELMSESTKMIERTNPQDVEAIARHLESGMTELGKAIEKSAHMFGRTIEREVNLIERKLKKADSGRSAGSLQVPATPDRAEKSPGAPLVPAAPKPPNPVRDVRQMQQQLRQLELQVKQLEAKLKAGKEQNGGSGTLR